MPYPGYTGWQVVLDPSAVATGRTQLAINDPSTGIQIGGNSSGQGIDWGQSAITELLSQEGQYGSTLADFLVPNRTITIPLGLGMGGPGTPTADQALAKLAQKVGLLQREGGWLMRQTKTGQPLYADIVDAQLTVPDTWGETGEMETGVTLTLICLPDFYGAEVALDSIACTGYCQAVLTSSGVTGVIPGDYPARCRFSVTDTSGNSQNSLIWGVRSRYYNGANTQQLVYSASTMTLLNGATAATLAGSQSTQVAKLAAPAANTWVSMVSTSVSSSNFNHQGTYRVWVRAYSATEAAQVRLLWGSADAAVPTTNTAAQLPGKGAFYLLDLGVVTLQAPPVGQPNWLGAIQAYCVTSGDDVQIDLVMFEPLAEGAGQLVHAPQSNVGLLDSVATTTTLANVTGVGSNAWTVSGGSATDTLTRASNYIEATGFGFAIPATATITGIQASFSLNTTAGSDTNAQLVKAGSIQATNRATGKSFAWGPHTITYGGATDLWGTTWAPADINNANFGFAWALTLTDPFPSATVSSFSMTVYYQIGAGIGTPKDAVVYASQTLSLGTEGIIRTFDGTVYGPVANIAGDLPRIPASGLESRAVQVFVKPSRGDLSSGTDSGIDTFTVTPYFRPTFLARI